MPLVLISKMPEHAVQNLARPQRRSFVESAVIPFSSSSSGFLELLVEMLELHVGIDPRRVVTVGMPAIVDSERMQSAHEPSLVDCIRS